MPRIYAYGREMRHLPAEAIPTGAETEVYFRQAVAQSPANSIVLGGRIRAF